MPKLVKPQPAERHVRVGAFGKDGVGKTHLFLSGPGRNVLMPIEGRYENFLDIFPFELIQFDEKRIVNEFADALNAAMRGEYNCTSFIADSYTVLEKALRAEQDYDTDAKGAVDRRSALGDRRQDIEDQILNNLRGTTKCNVFLTFHEANDFSKGGNVPELRPDATRNIGHYLDVLYRIYTEPQQNPHLPPKRFAKVYKSAFEHIMPLGKIIPNPTWENLIAPLTIITPMSTTTISVPPAQPRPAPAPASAQAATAARAAAVAETVTPAAGEYTEENPPKTEVLTQMWDDAHKPDASFTAWCGNELIEIVKRDGKSFFPPASRWKAYQRLQVLVAAAKPSVAA